MNQAYAPVQPAWSSIPNGQPQGYAPPQQGPEDNWNYGNPAPQNQQYPQQGGYQEQYPQNGYQSQQPYSPQGGYKNQQSEERNAAQICRKDAKNCFVESLRDSFNFGRVHFNFASYDLSRPAGNRQTGRVSIYIPVGEFLDLCRRMESGEILWTIQQAKQTGVTPPPIFESLGGTSARKLAKRGKSRSDGRSESRVMQVCVGRKADLVLSAKSGPGDESGKGLIVPKFGNNPENSVAVPMSYSLFCQLLLETRTHYQAWLAALYAKAI